MLRAEKPAQEKIETAEALEEIVKQASSIVLADFTGMSVSEFDKLRRLCFENQIIFRVAKNTLSKLALERQGHEDITDLLKGPTGFCFGFDDPLLPIHMLADFVKEHEKPMLKGCLMDGRLYDEKEIEILKKIPSRDALLAQIVSAIASPLSGIVYVLNETLRSFVSVIDSLSRQAETDSAGREGLTAIGGSVEQIIESIEKMTVLELVELKEALEEKFGVTAAAPVAVAAAPGAGEAAAEVEEQTEFTVILTAAGDKKIQVIKEVRAITALGLKEAKALVDSHPAPIKELISKDEAMAIKTKIEEAGGQAEIK